MFPINDSFTNFTSMESQDQRSYWVKSFLSNRTQHVSINGSHSALANVTSGVPQGSVLGPVLFLLYINDIANQIQSNIRLSADDSIVYREIPSPADHHILQTDILKLTDWSNKWQMNFQHIKVPPTHNHSRA